MTATGDAIEAALQGLTGKAPAAIVLLSDGKSTRGTDPLRPPGGQGPPHPHLHRRARHRRAAPSTAPRAARPADHGEHRPLTGGQAFTASDTTKLSAVYKRLGSQVTKEKQHARGHLHFAGGALALMALSALTSLGLTGRLL